MFDYPRQTLLRYPRNRFKRQWIMSQRRRFSMPKAWVFSADRGFYYLRFSKSLARRHYRPSIAPTKFISFGRSNAEKMEVL